MKKTLHFKTTAGRNNPIKTILLAIFTFSSSLPKALLEVFSRRGFGERYFSFAWCIIYAIGLAIVPIVKFYMPSFNSMGYDQSPSFFKFLLLNGTWYIFLAAFLYKSYGHWRDNRRSPSTFDFGKYSYCTGFLDKRFLRLQWNGKYLDIRFIETIVEPGFFALIGLGLMLLGQTVGTLIFISSLFFSGNRFLDYHLGDQIVLDMIDKIIISEDYEKAFIQDLDPEATRGLRFPTRKPSDLGQRRKVADLLFNEDEENDKAYGN